MRRKPQPNVERKATAKNLAGLKDLLKIHVETVARFDRKASEGSEVHARMAATGRKFIAALDVQIRTVTRESAA